MKCRAALSISISLLLVLLSCVTSDRPEPVENTIAETAESIPAEPDAVEPRNSVPESTESASDTESESLPPPADYYAAVIAAMEAGNAALALAEFERVLSDLPDDTENSLLYSSLLIANDRTADARFVLERILEEQPGNVEALYNLSLVEGMEGHDDLQIQLLDEILSIDSGDSRSFAAKGEILLRNGNFQQAMEAFDSCLAIDPDNVDALSGLGKTLLMTGKPEQAIPYFDKVIEKNPRSAFPYVDRSRARIETQEYLGAERDLSAAIELDPGFYWNYIDRGRIRLLALNNERSALDDFNRAIEIDGDFFYAYIFRAGILDRMDRREEAIEDYMKILESRHDYYHVYEPLASLLYMEERWKESRRYFRKAFDFNKIEYGYPLMVALAYKKEGLAEDAERYLRDAVVGIPGDTLAYQMVRLYLDPSYDAYMTGSLSRETDEYLKYKMLFYLGSYYLLKDQVILAQKYLLELENYSDQNLFERRIALWELEKFR